MFVGVGGEEDAEAARLVEKALGGKVLVVDVGRSGVRGWLLWEYGTDSTPLLVAADGAYYGLDAIRCLVRRLSRSR